MKTKKCIQCGETIIDRTTRQNRKFCDATCRTKYLYHNDKRVKEKMLANTRRRYQECKNNPNFKLKQRLNFNRWRKKNKKKINKAMREIMRKRNKIKPENYRIVERRKKA